MWSLLVAAVVFSVTAAINHGLNSIEIAEFKPINATRVEQNTNATGLVNISDPGGTYYTVYTNGVPSHSNYKWPRPTDLRPIYLKVRHTAFNIPKTPKLRDSPIHCVPVGVVGVATGGAAIYNAYVPRKHCPFANIEEVDDVDMCGGHPSPPGGYHYHGHSSCNRMEVCGEPSKIFGVALDGIPIYGPFDETGKQLTQTDLDICGGRIGADGRYRYHITGDPPFQLNCLRGEIHKQHLNTTYAGIKPGPDGFRCGCPVTDQGYPTCIEDVWCKDEGYSAEQQKMAEKAYGEERKKQPKMPNVCKWDVEGDTDWAECIDMSNTSYTPGFTHVRKPSTAKLIPCCPAGQDCGETCTDNSACYTEERLGMYLVTEISGVGGVVVSWLVTVLGLVNLL